MFSAGLDFDHHFPLFARRSTKEVDAWFEAYRATNLRIFTYPRPTVAAINGHAYAGGLIMPAVFCEIIKYAVGTSSASEMTLFGQVYDLASVQRMGVVNRIVPPELLIEEAIAWAGAVEPSCHPAYAFTKRALHAATLRAIDNARRLDLDLLASRMTDPGSLRAHARRYRQLKGRDPTWEIA